MAELNLTEVFGTGATQTSTNVTLLKADLTGLTPVAANSPDAVTLALLNKWTTTYTTAARQANPDISIVATMQPIPQVQGLFPPTVSVAQAFKVYTYTIQVFVPETVTAPSPDDVE